MHHRRIAAESFVLLAVAVLVLACSSPGGPTGSPLPATTTPASPVAADESLAPEALECEAAAYPCALSDVAPDILARSDDLGGQVATLLREGGTMAEAEAFVAGQDGIAEVEADDIVLRFRLDGGRGVWVMTAGAFAPGSRSSGSPDAARVADQLATVASYAIAGGDTESKSAVVLSPFLWDFGETDDGADVAAMLEQTRGYAGNVAYSANATQDDTEVGIDSFKGWRKHQVIHVSSHGARLCKHAPCRAVIIAGTIEGTGSAVTERGVDIVKTTTTADRGLVLQDDRGRTLVALTADFFRSEYPGGLDDAVVFFNACSTYGAAATDLGDTVRGQTSVFLGWSEPVGLMAAQDAAMALYASLGRDGLAVGAAYDALDTLQVDPDPNGSHARLNVAGPVSGSDLRIRQVVAFRGSGGSILSATDQVPIEGVGGDGLADSVPYTVTVDGVSVEEAPLTTVNVSIDGQAAAPVVLSTGTQVDPGRWSVDGLIDLGYDLAATRAVDFRASADLSEGGTSTHTTLATIGSAPVMGLTWSGQATEVAAANGDGSVEARATAQLTFSYVPGPDGDGTSASYKLTDATVTWQIDGTDSSGCRVLSPVTTLTAADLDYGAGLVFDLRKDPVEYTASANVSGGPLVEVSVTCPDKNSTYTTRAGFILGTMAEHLTVVGDVLSGSYRFGVSRYDWEFHRDDR